jgi:DNA-binding LacI/PurR family transcriptional regulator
MKHCDTRTERKTDRQDVVVKTLRADIVGGQLAPGSRLPNRVEIENNFGASSITVQRALGRLKDEGFVTASRRNGTFVALHPPHLSHYALVFSSRPTTPEWNRFWEAIRTEARKLEADGPIRFPLYYDVNGHEDSEDYQSLVRAVQAHRFAGMILVNPPSQLRYSPIFESSGLPFVTLASRSDVPGMPVVVPSQKSLTDRGLDLLAEAGCKNVALFQTTGYPFNPEPALQQRGLHTRPYWKQDISLWYPAAARKVTHLLMNDKQQERPDGIFVSDDNLLESVALGLMDAGVRVPQDVRVVSHCNFPYPVECPVPVTRVGFDSAEVLARCMALLEMQRDKTPYELCNQIFAVSEAELLTRTRATARIMSA